MPSVTDAFRPLTRRILVGLLAWDFCLIGAHFLFNFTWRFRHTPNAVRAIFRVASEDSLVVWTSVVCMFALGVLCICLGSLQRSRGWQLSGLFFVFLSMDDEAMLHERLGRFSEVQGQAVYHWVIVFMPVLAVLGVATFRHVWRASGRELRPRVLLAYGLWFLALAFEVAEKQVTEAGLAWRGYPLQNYTKLVEESCELIAPALLLSCLLDLLSQELVAREH